MKNIPLLAAAVALCFASPLAAQLHIKGATVMVNTGATLFVDGNLKNVSAGKLTNKGTIELTGDWDNAATVTQSGTAAKVIFSGTPNATVKSGNKAFYKIELRKTGASLFLSDNMTVNKEIRFGGPTLPNCFLLLGDHNLKLAAAATIADISPTNYIVTDGAGQLQKTNCATFLFPVGANSSQYNPLTIAETGTKDIKGVRCLESPLSGGDAGLPLAAGAANVSWQITESVAGGSNATVTAQWAAGDELPLFDRTNAAVHRHDGVAWQALTAGGASQGNDPYTRKATGVNAFGYFMVATPSVFLQNPDDRENAAADPQAADFQIFPNPTSDRLTVRASVQDAPVEGLVMDARGAVLRRFTMVDGQHSLDVRHLPAGIYCVRLTAPDGQDWVKQFVKMD